MKQIKKLLIEYEIRFRDTDKIKEDGLTFGINSINQYIYKPTISVHSIWNTHGKVYLDGEWATADLKEVPEKWVVEKDENHPMWERFRESQISRNGAGIGFGYMYYNESHIFNDNLTYFTDHQFLTLDQWAKFFLPKIDFSIINNKDWFYVRSLGHIYFIKGGIKIQNDRLIFDKGCWISTNILLRNGKFVLNKIIEFRKANNCELDDLFNEYPELISPKTGDWGLFYDDIESKMYEIKKHGSIEIRKLKSFNKNGFIREYSAICWNNFFLIDLTKPIKDEINRFLEFAKSDYRL